MSDKPRSTLGRLFNLLWTLVSGFLRLMVILTVVGSLAMWWFILRGGSQIEIEPNMPLVIAPTGALVEYVDEDPGQRLLERFNSLPPSQSELAEMITAIDRARDDDRIPFAVLKLDEMTDAGLPQLEELNTALREFRAAGKKVIAWGPYYDQAGYFAAAQADEIVLDPWGMVAIEGFSSYNNYFKEALDKLNIDMHVFRVGSYKSAVEPFTRSNMSPEARAANQQWLGDLWGIYGHRLGAARKLPTTVADDYVNRMADSLEVLDGDAATYARQAGLVTHLETLGAFRKRMGAMVGMDEDLGSFRQIHYLDYLHASGREADKIKSDERPHKIAVVHVQGEIVDGFGDIGQAGGDSVSELLDEARRDESVAAVVLRVNSPGGSVWASEQIRRGVNELRADGKPVVASMSTVAASGGYWVSMDADRIFAHSSTVTGSIGIFGMIPTLDRALGKLGIRTDGVGTTALAGGLRIDRPLSPELGRIVQSQIDKGYRDFIGGVAQARKLPIDRVDSIAQGRVWSGERAQSLGLIDEFGGQREAAAAAARLAGLTAGDYEVETLRPEGGFAQQLLSDFSGQSQTQMLWRKLPDGMGVWAQRLLSRSDIERVLSRYNDPRGMYAHCFCTPSQGGAR